MVSLTHMMVGQYYPAESPIHSLDPRIKIVLSLIFMIVLFVINNFIGLMGVVAFIAFIVHVSKVPWKLILRGLRPLLYILIFAFFVHLFFTPGRILLAAGPLKATEEGLINGLFTGSRLLLIVMGTSLLTLTTSPIQLTDGMEYLLYPLKVVKVPAHEMAMMMTIALRFIPTLMVEADKIMKAQMARGADFESGNVVKRAKSYIPVLVPLFVSAFRRADELALAMESRCYRGGEGRTRMRELSMGTKDWLALVLSILILAGIVLMGRMGVGSW